MNLEQKSEASITIKPLRVDIPDLRAKSCTDPLEERELEFLLRERPDIAMLILHGMFQRIVDHAGKYFIVHLHEPIE